MKKLLILISILWSSLAIAQSTDAELTTQVSTQISTKAYSPTRAGQMFQALVDSKQAVIGVLTASGTNTYTVTANSDVTSYISGQYFLVKFTNGNTGAATLNVNSIGAVALKKEVSTALESGDLPAGGVFMCVYDGTNFQVIGGAGGGGSSYTFGSGLTESSGAVSLGGTSSGNILVDGEHNKQLVRAEGFVVAGPGWNAIDSTSLKIQAGGFELKSRLSNDGGVFGDRTATLSLTNDLVVTSTSAYYKWLMQSVDPISGQTTEMNLDPYYFKVEGGTSAHEYISLDFTNSLFHFWKAGSDGFHFDNTDTWIGNTSGGKFFGYNSTGTYLNLSSNSTGDTYYRNSSGYLNRVTIGSSGSFYRSTGSAPSWSTLTIPNTLTTKSLLVANTANTLTGLTLTAGQSVRLNAGGTAFEGYTPFSSPLTTEGDLMLHNGSTSTRLAIGAANTVLTSAGGSAIWQTPASSFSDNLFKISDDGDNTKQLYFQASGISTSTSRTLTAPDANGTLVLNDNTAALTNKSFSNSISYNDDYSTAGIASFGDRWIPDKEWVDAAIEAGLQSDLALSVVDVLLSGTSLTLDDTYLGKIIYTTNSSAVTITVPPGLVNGFNCVVIQDGTGIVSLSIGAVTMVGKTATTGQYDALSILNYKATDTYIGK